MKTSKIWASLKQLTMLSPDHCVNYLLTEQKMFLCSVADHGQLGFFSHYSFKHSLWSGWINFNISPDHGNPNWPSIPFKKSWLLFNVAADHGQLGFFLIIWLYKQFLIMLNQFWCFTWPWKPQLTITSIPKQLTIFQCCSWPWSADHARKGFFPKNNALNMLDRIWYFTWPWKP